MNEEYYEIKEDLISIFEPLEKLLPSEWCEKYVYLPIAVSNKNYGFVRLQKWQKEILNDLVLSPNTKTRVIRSSAQSGKTTILLLVALYNLYVLQQNSFLVLHDEKTAKDVMERLRNIVRSSPALKPMYRLDKGAQSKFELRLKNGVSCKIATAGSGGSLRSFSAGCVILDEVDAAKSLLRGEGSLIEIAEARTISYGESANIWICSTPTTQHGNISLNYEKSLAHEWQITCPSCKNIVSLEFKQISYNKEYSARLLEDNADEITWKCPICKSELNQKKFRAIRESGQFTEIKNQDEKSSYVKGFHISGLMSLQKTFLDLCRKHKEAKVDKSKWQTFLNLELGEVYTASLRYISAENIRKNISKDLKAGVPHDETMLVIKGVDVGHKEGTFHYYIVTIGILPNAKFCIFAHDYVETDSELRVNLLKQYTTPNGRTIKAHQCWMDTGDGPVVLHCYDLVGQTPGLIACKGIGTGFELLRYTKNNQANVNMALIHKQKSFEYFFKLLEFGAITFAEGMSKNYFESLQTWAYDIDARKYVEKYPDSPDHYLDASRIALVAFTDIKFAELRKIENFNEFKMIFEPDKEAQQKDKPTAPKQNQINPFVPNPPFNSGKISPFR